MYNAILQSMAENCPVSCKAFKNNLGIAKDSACYTINIYMQRYMLYCKV